MKVTIDIPKKFLQRSSLLVTAFDDKEEFSDEMIKEFLDTEHLDLDLDDIDADEDNKKQMLLALSMVVLAKFVKEHEKD